MIREIFIKLFIVVIVLTNLGCQSSKSEVDNIVNEYIGAIGGKDKLHAIHSIKLTGQYYLNGLEYPLTVLRKRPNLYRVEISMNDKKVVAGFDGETAWEINEFRSSEANEIKDLRSKTFIERNTDFDGALVDYKEKGHQVELVGKENVDGTETYLLKVTLNNGKIENWYIDSSNFTVLKRTSEIPHPYDPNADNIFQVFFYMDYEQVDGLLIPHYTEREDMQYIREYVIENVEMNPEIDNNLFKVSLKATEG